MSPPTPNELSELMALLAHDLRNPLSALLTNLNFVRSAMRDGAPELQEALSDSALSCAMLSQYIGNLDVLARSLVDAPPRRRATDLHQAAEEAVARAQAQATAL